jgi:hypothetical protein
MGVFSLKYLLGDPIVFPSSDRDRDELLLGKPLADLLHGDKMSLNIPQLVEEIREAGTDNLGHFGNGYKRDGGYSLQQNPDEFAAAVACIKDLCPNSSHSYLEIGIASGGTVRFIAERVGFSRIFVMDDRGHARAGEQNGNLAAIGRPITRFYGDSHSPAARNWMRGIVGKVDFVFIDGDHSYDGCKKDFELVYPFARYVMFHDTVACEGVKRVWDEGIAQGKIRAVLHVAGEERPLGIGIGEVLR